MMDHDQSTLAISLPERGKLLGMAQRGSLCVDMMKHFGLLHRCVHGLKSQNIGIKQVSLAFEMCARIATSFRRYSAGVIFGRLQSPESDLPEYK